MDGAPAPTGGAGAVKVPPTPPLHAQPVLQASTTLLGPTNSPEKGVLRNEPLQHEGAQLQTGAAATGGADAATVRAQPPCLHPHVCCSHPPMPPNKSSLPVQPFRRPGNGKRGPSRSCNTPRCAATLPQPPCPATLSVNATHLSVGGKARQEPPKCVAAGAVGEAVSFRRGVRLRGHG